MITIVGLGPGPVAQLTKEAEAALLGAERIFFRTGSHPVHDWLKEKGKHVVCFDKLYAFPWKVPGEIYEFIVGALLKETALHDPVVYAVPGSPAMLEDTARLLQERRGVEGLKVKVIHGLSFVEEALAQVNLDFADGLQVVLPRTHLESGRFTSELAILVCQIEAAQLPGDKPRVDLTMEWLLKVYPPDHPVTLIWTDGLPEYRTQSMLVELKDLSRDYGQAKYFASLFVPPLANRREECAARLPLSAEDSTQHKRECKENVGQQSQARFSQCKLEAGADPE